MKIMHDLIIRRLDIAKDFDLNQDYMKSVWTFYQIYNICINLLGIKDSNLRKKNKLIKQMILNPDNFTVLNKLKDFISEDNRTIEIALNSLEEKEDIEEIYYDFYPDSVFGVNIDDRNN